MPEHRELETLGGGCRGGLAAHLGVFSVVIDGAEAQEVEHKGINDLVRQRVLLLEEDTDEDVDGTSSFRRQRRGGHVGGNVAHAKQCSRRVQDRNGYTRDNR